MFPTPIEKTSRSWQLTYQSLLPVVLIAWLLPLIAVAVFSIKPDSDFANANYWGWPSSFEGLTNYGKVFLESDMPRYLLNSFLITVPTVIGAVALSSMTGFALGIYKFRGNLLIFFMFQDMNEYPACRVSICSSGFKSAAFAPATRPAAKTVVSKVRTLFVMAGFPLDSLFR